MNGEPQKKKTSPWVWVAVGCFGVVALGILIVVGVGWFGYSKAKQFGEEMKDPVKREAKVKEVLHAETLPEGYHPVIAMTVPFVMKMAVLSDHAPETGGKSEGGFDKQGFFFMEMLHVDKQKQEFDDYFAGKSQNLSFVKEQNSDIEVHERLGVGEGDFAGGKLRWVATRGSFSQRKEGTVEGLVSTISVDCKDDDKTRIGVWFTQDPKPDAKEGDPALAGTPADPKAIEAFMGHFHLCGGGA